MANPSFQRTLAVEGTKAAVSVIGAPIKYIYKWTKAAIAGVLGYGKGIFAETFWGFKNGNNKVKEEFKNSQSERAIASTRFKKGISDVFWGGKDVITKNMGSFIKGSTKAIGQVLKGVAYGVVGKPINKVIVEPTKKYVIDPVKKNIIEPTKKWFGDNFSPEESDTKIIPIDKSKENTQKLGK